VGLAGVTIGMIQQSTQRLLDAPRAAGLQICLAEQKRIFTKVDQLMALCYDLEAKLRRAEEGAQKLAEAMVAEIVAQLARLSLSSASPNAHCPSAVPTLTAPARIC